MKVTQAEEYLLVIDEVHKIDNWSEAVKKEWDEDSFNDLNMKVVILGSSRLLLKDGLTESLAGRYELIRMPHWSFAEMHEAFNLDVDQYIYFGGYPGGAMYIKDERRWRKYIKDSIVAPAIEKDVLRTKVIYKPALMKQLFELGCAYSSEELSLYYWREREDEVDFIMEYDKRCIAIEVKSGRRTSNEGLSVFRDKFHPAQSFVVGSGGIPIDEFLSWDIGRLLDREQRRQSKTRLSYAES